MSVLYVNEIVANAMHGRQVCLTSELMSVGVLERGMVALRSAFVSNVEFRRPILVAQRLMPAWRIRL